MTNAIDSSAHASGAVTPFVCAVAVMMGSVTGLIQNAYAFVPVGECGSRGRCTRPFPNQKILGHLMLFGIFSFPPSTFFSLPPPARRLGHVWYQCCVSVSSASRRHLNLEVLDEILLGVIQIT